MSATTSEASAPAVRRVVSKRVLANLAWVLLVVGFGAVVVWDEVGDTSRRFAVSDLTRAAVVAETVRATTGALPRNSAELVAAAPTVRLDDSLVFLVREDSYCIETAEHGKWFSLRGIDGRVVAEPC